MSSVSGFFRAELREPPWPAPGRGEEYEAASRRSWSNAESRIKDPAKASAATGSNGMVFRPALRIRELTPSRFRNQQGYIAVVRGPQTKRKQYADRLAIIESVGFRT